MINRNYIGRFQDIAKHDYTVLFLNREMDPEIHTNTNVILAGDPVTIEYENSDDTLYKPVKLSGATIRLVTTDVDEYYFDLYSNNPQKIEVEIRRGNSGPTNLVWHGYVEPSLYTQGFECQNEEIEINCLDGLSILKYYKYTSIDENPGYHSFMDIIQHILGTLKRVGFNEPFYRYLFFHKTVFTSKEDTDNILKKLYVNESVFFDQNNNYDSEGNRITDKDDTMLEVLEKIMTYLGMTMYAENNHVWILDYDAVSTDVQTYHNYSKIDLSNNTDTDISVMIPQVLIGQWDYAENGQSISLDKVYNKVTVVDKFDKIDKLLPDLYNDSDLTEIYPNDTLNGNPPKLSIIWNEPRVEETELLMSAVNHSLWCYYKVMLNKNYIFYAYDDAGNEVQITNVINQVTPKDPSVVEWPIQNAENRISGGVLPWFSVAQPDYLRSTGQCGCIMKAKTIKNEDYPILEGNTIVPYFNYDNYLLLQTNEYKWKNNKKNSQDGTITRRPSRKLVSVTPTFKPPFLSGNGKIYLIITGSCFMEDRYNIFGYDSEHKRKSDDWSVAGLVVSLRIGDKWWSWDWRTQAPGSWVNSETTFRIPLWNKDHDHWIGQELKIKNNIPYTWGINKEGWAIPLPDNVELETGELEVCLYTPIPPTDDGATWDHSSYLLESTWIRNFNVELHVMDEETNKVSNDDSDTCYTNIIDTNNIEKLDDIDFDLCTFDNKTISNNCVYVKDGSIYNYLDKVYNPYVSQHLNQEYDQLARFEELYCCRVANQYNTPKVKLEVNLNMDFRMDYPFTENILKKVYIIDSKEINLRDNNIKYTLIEKA